MKLVGKHQKTAEKIQKALKGLPDFSTIICIDPASRSLGYSKWRKENDEWCLFDSGKVVAKGDINDRLSFMYKELTGMVTPDAVFIEFLGGSTGHKYLLWAAGVIAAAFPYMPLVEVQTGLWKRFIDKNYTKDDEIDAIYIGKCVTEISGWTEN